MRFPFQFTRRIGGTGAVPVLGSDVAPVDRGDLTDSNVFKTSVPSGIAVQRLAVAYSYTGAGVPVALSAKVYLYDGTTERWYTTDANDITLKPGDISYVSISQIIGKSQVVGGDPYVSTANSLEIALVVAASGTDPDGIYAFPMGLDLGDVADEDALLPVVATAAKQDIAQASLASIVANMATSALQSAAPLTNTHSAALEASRVVKASACSVRSVCATNTSGADLYLHIFDAATLPANGTIPARVVVKVPAQDSNGLSWDGTSAFANGCVAALSSTQGTLTIAGAVGLFDAEVL